MKFPPFVYNSSVTPATLLLCAFLLYLPTFNGTWAMDDYSVIVNNPDIRTFGDFLANRFPGRPLREVSYLFDYFCFGLDPWGYHFQNIFWHALNCWLVYLLALRLNPDRTIAWISSILFLVHPIHVEVAANSSHRKDSLALAFLLMALFSYMNMFRQNRTSRKVIWLVCSGVLWVIAFFAKGNSLVFPALVLAYEYALVPAEQRIFIRWKWMVPLLCGSSVVGILAWYGYISSLPSFRMAIMGAFIKTEHLTGFSVPSYILMVLKSIAFMFSKLILPVGLSMEYIYKVPDSFLDPWVISALVMIPASFVLAFRWKSTSPPLFFLLLSGAILWLPTSNIFWHFSYFAADRYMYAPSAFLCILAALLSERLLPRARRYVLIGWVCILGAGAILTWNQAWVWQNDLSLYSRMLKISPRSLEGMVGLSNAYYSVKEYDTSARYAEMALKRDGTDYRPYLTLGNIHYVHGRLTEAQELFLEAQKKNPQAPEVHNALGSLYDDQGKSDQAIESFKTALNLRHDYFEAYTNLGVAFERVNNLPEAESMLNKALAVNSNHVPAWYNLGIVRYRNNNKPGARNAFTEAVLRDPTHKDALTNLSIVCRESGDEVCYNDAVRRLDAVRSGEAVKSPRR